MYWSTNGDGAATYLYFQNYTSLNPFFEVTGESPGGMVGGIWPELGFLPPVSPTKPLKANQELCISDAFISVAEKMPSDSISLCRHYVEQLAQIYHHLEKPEVTRKDWIGLANKALEDLKSAESAHVECWDCLYLHPYVDAEYPDSAVQLCGSRQPLVDPMHFA